MPRHLTTTGDPRPRVLSLRRADARNLVLSDVDLTFCEFYGAHNLDHLRLEGAIGLRETPRGLHGRWAFPPVWIWTRRRAIAEEHRWRSETRKADGWGVHLERAAKRDPSQLVDETFLLLRGIRDRYEARYRCAITDEALEQAIREAEQYFPERHLPEKAIELLEHACVTARVRAQPWEAAYPPHLSELESEIEEARLAKESAIDLHEFEEAAAFRDKERKLTQKRRDLEETWLTEERSAAELDDFEQPEVGAEIIVASLPSWAGAVDTSPVPWVRDSAYGREEADGAGLTLVGAQQREPLSPTCSEISEIYRALRKGREDGKDAPGAADFYYGEMEMRRHASSSSMADKSVVFLYWSLSGYGLRASRALLALASIVALFGFLFSRWGFAPDSRSSYFAGVIHSAESAMFFRAAQAGD